MTIVNGRGQGGINKRGAIRSLFCRLDNFLAGASMYAALTLPKVPIRVQTQPFVQVPNESELWPDLATGSHGLELFILPVSRQHNTHNRFRNASLYPLLRTH